MEDAEILMRLKKEVREAREVHAQLSYSLGAYYGYPHCCRMEFADDILLDRDSTQRNVDGSGFIPCRKHFLQIGLKEIKLSDLIKDRVCPTPLGPSI